MITDARSLPPDFIIKGDVCVVGSGAAGITLANELSNAGLDLILLEGGGTRVESKIQDLYKGQVVNPDRHGPLHLYRLRHFGGTTSVWGGRCAPFDAIDFEERSYVPYSGWPVTRKELDPFYERAHAYCDLGEYLYDVRSAMPPNSADMIPGFRSDDVFADSVWRFSLPTDFGKSFKDRLSGSGRAGVYLHANCVKIHMQKDGTSVDYLEAASSESRRFKVKARSYALAVGGLEVVRLLLASNDVCRNGIGNDRDLVGRFYISHMTGDLGEVAFTPKGGPLVWEYEQTKDGIYCRRNLRITESRQLRDKLMNFRAILAHPPIADPRHGNGVLSGVYLVKRLLIHRLSPEYSKALAASSPLQRVTAHGWNIVKDIGTVARFSPQWVRKRILSKRKLPSVAFESKGNIYTLHFDAEQSPNPDSRVSLSESKDRFGVPRLKVDWCCTDADIDSVIRSARLVVVALEGSGVGKALFQPELLADAIRSECYVGAHHIGTTRMASSPSRGVVDANCRVHGVDNLFVASSSVFPTASFANPVLTTVAFALRLADHLKYSMQAARSASSA
jgi:GMC oxidoreductase